MSAAVTLSLAQQPEHTLVADCIAADRFASLGAKQIAELPVVHGGRRATLGDFFKVRGVQMIGGRIDVGGDAGDNAGGARPGASRGTAGGEIVILRSGGAGAGGRVRRGPVGAAGERRGGAGRRRVSGPVGLVVEGRRGAGVI